MPTTCSSAIWNDAVVIMAANDISAELPEVPLPVIIQAAAVCRREVPATSGASALRHCTRRRALGLHQATAAAASEYPPSTQ